MENIRKYIHDLSNKIAIAKGKTRKLDSLVSDTAARVELEKLKKSIEDSTLILEDLKSYIINE